MRHAFFFCFASFTLGTVGLVGCTAENGSDASDVAALSSGHETAFIPYVDPAVIAQRVDAFRARNGADWEVAPGGDDPRFIASPGSMKSKGVVGAKKELTKDEGRAVAREFFAKNADLLSIDATTIDANLDVYKSVDGMGGTTYLGWYIGLKTPLPPIALYPDSSSYDNTLWVQIDVDGVVRELDDRATRMPAMPLDLDARYAPLDAPMTATFLGKHVERTGLQCNASTLELVEVTKDLGTISASDLAPVKVLRSLPKHDGVEVHLAYDYRLGRFGWEYVVDATNAEVFRRNEPTRFFGGAFGACW
jgi:hypothetical protein